MSRSFEELEKKFSELKLRFSEIENLNQFLARQAQEYFLLFDSIRKLNNARNSKALYKSLDKIFYKNFGVDEYALILKNPHSNILSIVHSMGLPKRELREIFYEPEGSVVGKVFSTQRPIYIPDVSILKGFSYYYQKKKVQGSLYYLPITNKKEPLGVVKMRKVVKEGFTEIERSVLPNLQAEITTSLFNAEQIDQLASSTYLDELTGLYNRRYYNKHFQIEFKRAQRYGHDLSVVFLDIDNFKSINDRYGHSTGDEVLCMVAEVLNKKTRGSDICIRYGGDEFIILLPETHKLAASETAEKLRRAISDLHVPPNGSSISISIGIASYQQDTIEPKRLIELADRALLDAKKAGKNQIAIAGTSQPSENEEKP